MLYKFGLRRGERERINTGNLYFFSSLIPHPSSLVFASRATPGKDSLGPSASSQHGSGCLEQEESPSSTAQR